MSKLFELMGSESPRSIDEIMAKNGIQPTCRCDKCYEMVTLLDEEIKRYWEKSITLWFRHHDCHCVNKFKLLEIIKKNPGKFDNNVTELGEDFCPYSSHIYTSLVEFQSLNNYLDYLDNKTKDNELAKSFLIAEFKPEDQHMASQSGRSLKDLMARRGIRPDCPCDKCNVMRKLLDENMERFTRKSWEYNRRHKYANKISRANIDERLQLDLGKFNNKISGPGDNPCYNNAHIYYLFIQYETYNNYIDYLEKNAKDDGIAGPSSITESKLEDLLMVSQPHNSYKDCAAYYGEDLLSKLEDILMVIQPLRSSKKLSKPKDQQMASQPSRSFKKLMARHGIKPTCYCNKCNEMNKLLKKNIEQFKKKSCVYNARHKFSERICISSVMKRLKLDLGKFANKISGPGDDPCYNTPLIYYRLIEYETYNNYIDYLEKNAEDDEIAGPSSIAESKPFQLVGSESHWYVDEIMAKNGIKPTCRCDKCYVMVKLLDEEAQRYLEKSITFWFRHHNYHCVDKLKMLELIKSNPGKFDNNVTELGEDFCVNSRHIYKSLVEFESLNNHLDHLDNNIQENGLVNPFLIAESKSDHQMVCQPCPSLNKCVVEEDINCNVWSV